VRTFVLRIDALRDPEHTRRRADRGDFTPPGFEHIEPARAGFETDKIELVIRELDPDEAAHWSIGPAAQLRRDVPLLPPPRGVVR